ncbi:MAG: ABC-three component system middle component 6 [Vulcanimicrobiota bacterium]
MILPTKHVSTEYSLLGAGADVLRHLDSPHTITGLWEKVRNATGTCAYWRFILALDFLFAIGVIDLIDGLLVKNKS